MENDPMPPKTTFIWLDGKLVEWENATVHILSQGLHYGAGVFEGMRCYRAMRGSAVFRLDEHIARFFASAKIMGLELAHSKEQIRGAVIETILANGLPECYVRPIAFGGNGGFNLTMRGVPTHMAIAVWPWENYVQEGGSDDGIKLKISSFTRMHLNASMTKAKITGNYVNSILAKQEAADCGADEALLLDQNGLVSEATGENVFLVKNSRISTPPAETILEGITRDCIISLAADMGMSVIERNITRDQLYAADEVFLTGTAAEVVPVAEIDGRTLGNGKAGEITKKLKQEFFRTSRGSGEKYAEWLSYVDGL